MSNATITRDPEAGVGSLACSAAFDRWTKQRGVWPRLTYEEIWSTAWRAAMESIWERLPMPAYASDPMTPKEVQKLLAYVKSNLPNPVITHAADSGSLEALLDNFMSDQNTQMLGEIAMAISDDVPKEICLTVDGVRWLRDRYRAGQNALRELEKIRTEKLAVRELENEANAVSAARALLSNTHLSESRENQKNAKPS